MDVIPTDLSVPLPELIDPNPLMTDPLADASTSGSVGDLAANDVDATATPFASSASTESQLADVSAAEASLDDTAIESSSFDAPAFEAPLFAESAATDASFADISLSDTTFVDTSLDQSAEGDAGFTDPGILA